jgi:flagellar FliJ protein
VKSPRFKFGLERVRELRAHDEDRAKEAFASSLNERVLGAALLAAADERLDGARAVQREGAVGASGTDLVARQAYLEQVERSRADAERDLANRDAALAARRQALAEASRRRQALEKLKERRAEEHRLEAARAEGAFLDEIALSAHVRRGRVA